MKPHPSFQWAGTQRCCLPLSLLVTCSVGSFARCFRGVPVWNPSLVQAAAGSFLCLLCCKHSAEKPWKFLFALTGASRELRLRGYWCFGMSSMILSIPLAFALTWFRLLFSCIRALNRPSGWILLSSHITLKQKLLLPSLSDPRIKSPYLVPNAHVTGMSKC